MASKLDLPIVEFREKPIKEIYKKLVDKVENLIDPKCKKIPDQNESIYNMMLQAGGNQLNVMKQICTVGHRAKRIKGAIASQDIKTSESTDREKFIYVKKLGESNEYHAVAKTFMTIKLQ